MATVEEPISPTESEDHTCLNNNNNNMARGSSKSKNKSKSKGGSENGDKSSPLTNGGNADATKGGGGGGTNINSPPQSPLKGSVTDMFNSISKRGPKSPTTSPTSMSPIRASSPVDHSQLSNGPSTPTSPKSSSSGSSKPNSPKLDNVSDGLSPTDSRNKNTIAPIMTSSFNANLSSPTGGARPVDREVNGLARPPLDVKVMVVNGKAPHEPPSSRGSSVSSPRSPLGSPRGDEPMSPRSMDCRSPPLSPSGKPPIPTTSALGLKPSTPVKTTNAIDEPLLCAPSPTPSRPGDIGDMSRPGSAMSVSTVISPTDSVTSSRNKMTVGEIVQQIESKSASLLKKEDFTKPDTLADLHFLAQQSRYNSDMHVKRKLVTKMVENGVLDIFLRVHRSAYAVDYLTKLSLTSDNKEVAGAEAAADNQSISGDADPDDLNVSREGRDDSETRSISEADGVRQSPRDRLQHVPDVIKNFRSALTTLTNVTERSPSLCEECIRKGMIAMLLTDLSDGRLSVPQLKESNKMYIVRGYLGVLNNIIRFHNDAREIYRDAGAIKILQHYLKSNLLIIKMRTIMVLSYLISEAENDIINASDKNISLLLKVLQSTLESDTHYSKKYGYWSVEILAGLNRLGAFESNKEKIVGRGALQLYTRFLSLSSCSEEEQLLGAQGIWVLSFFPQNRRLIRDEPQCIPALETLSSTSGRDEIRRTARGALWVTLDKGVAHKSASLPAGMCAGKELSAAAAGTSGHVMLSYQWASKTLVHRIKERLKNAGYKVWMDIENTGNQRATLEAMADAVDKASVVLVCMSQKYKDSPNCRTEAEFAYRLKKDLIPLRMQLRYNPDGWLGRLLGTKLSFDFSREENMDSMMSNLVRDLGNKGRIRPMEQSLDASRTTLWASQTSLVLPPMEVAPHVLSWTSEDVARWLTENSLSPIREKLKQVNGELLLEIKRMQRHAPEAFYNNLKTDLQLDFVTTLKFTKALEKL